MIVSCKQGTSSRRYLFNMPQEVCRILEPNYAWDIRVIFLEGLIFQFAWIYQLKFFLFRRLFQERLIFLQSQKVLLELVEQFYYPIEEQPVEVPEC